MDTTPTVTVIFHWRPSNGGLDERYKQSLQKLGRVIGVQHFRPLLPLEQSPLSPSYAEDMLDLTLSAAVAVVVLDDEFMNDMTCRRMLEIVLQIRLPVHLVLADEFGLGFQDIASLEQDPLWVELANRLEECQGIKAKYVPLSRPVDLRVLTFNRIVGMDRAGGDIGNSSSICVSEAHALDIVRTLPAVSPLMYVFRTDALALYTKQVCRTNCSRKLDVAVQYLPLVMLLADMPYADECDFPCNTITEARSRLNKLRLEKDCPGLWAYFNPQAKHVWIKRVDQITHAVPSNNTYILT